MRTGITILAGLLALLLAGDACGGWLPVQQPAPSQKMGGLISIPGAPLPPVSRDVVETSIKLFEPLLAGLRLFGDTAAVGRGCGYLATLYAALGDDAKAEQLFDEAQAILEKSRAAPLYSAWVQNNRGMWHNQAGRHAAAIKSFQSAVSLLTPEIAETSEARVTVLQNLGTAYWLLGDTDRAESAFADAVDLLHRRGMERSHTGQMMRANLAMLDSSIGDFVAARSGCEKLLEEPGLDRRLRFTLLVNLGYVLTASRQFAEAEARFVQARALTADRSPERVAVLMNLASTYGMAEDYEHAESLGQEVLSLARELYGEDSRIVAGAMMILGLAALSRNELVGADRLITRATAILGKNRGDEEIFVFATRELALVAQLRGQTERATALSREALGRTKEQLARILAFGSETQRLAYRAHAAPFDQLANLGDPLLLADAVLSMKGVVLESLLAERALARKSTAAADRDHLDRIHELKVRLMEETGREGRAPESLQRELTREETALARRLAPQLPRQQVPVDLVAVQTSLGLHEVLIEIIRYQRYTGRGKIVWSYGGVVIPHRGPPSWVPLGESEHVDASVEKLIRRIDGGQRAATPDGINELTVAKEEEVRMMLRSLYESLWTPLVHALPPETEQVLLSPDAAISFLPWAALIDEEGCFVAEKWQLTQISSGRELVTPSTQPAARTLVAFADGRGDLLYARQEVETIAGAARSHGWRATVFIGEQATERELERDKGPRILHIATHAGQLRDDVAHVISHRLSGNPMYRGFLLLRGGDETLNRWRSGKTVPAEDDGILTAEEASGLDLSDTWLTVLSACDTGAGDVRAGEGVLGLRRGFALAGTRYLLFSLWSVDDDATAQFMKVFYQRLFDSSDPARAFWEAQLAELVRWKNSGSVAGAVYRAGAFVLSR
jgi:tetratricopeptide (TPR) repeat protein